MSITTTIPSITGYTGTVPDKATQTKTDFANSINPYLNYVDNTFIPSYEAAKTSLNTFATQANALATQVNDDAVATAADVMLTHADVVLTNADVVLTHADVVLTHADVVATAAIYDAFDDRELGSKTSAPTLDNDGNALQEGAQYWNSVLKKKFIWDGSAWVDQTVIPTDHGSLTGLTDDDHTQYHNDARGDARYAKLSGANFSGAINTVEVTVASSATTSDIWTGGNIIDFTGTATVTDFPAAPQAGSQRTLICAGACSFTASANMLINGVTSGQTVTCSAGDKIDVIAKTTTQFLLNRIKADGKAQVETQELPSQTGNNGKVLTTDGTNPSWKTINAVSLNLLETITVSTPVASITSTIFSTTYEKYIIEIEGLKLSTASYPRFRLETGGTPVTSGYWYAISSNTTISMQTQSSTLGYFPVTHPSSNLNYIGGTIGFNGDIQLIGCNSGGIKQYRVQGVHELSTSAGSVVNDMGNGVSNNATLTAGSVSGLTLTVGDGGNFTDGKIKIYGVG